MSYNMTNLYFYDTGWSRNVSDANIIDQSGNKTWNKTITNTDINNILTRPGVFLIDGTRTNISSITPIYCSVDNLNNIGSGLVDGDNAYLVYPDYGFRLFQSTGYNIDASTSNVYFNTSDTPIVFTLGGQDWGGNSTNKVYYRNTTQYYDVNITNSIRIFHRSYVDNITSYKISGLSGSTT